MTLYDFQSKYCSKCSATDCPGPYICDAREKCALFKSMVLHSNNQKDNKTNEKKSDDFIEGFIFGNIVQNVRDTKYSRQTVQYVIFVKKEWFNGEPVGFINMDSLTSITERVQKALQDHLSNLKVTVSSHTNAYEDKVTFNVFISEKEKELTMGELESILGYKVKIVADKD